MTLSLSPSETKQTPTLKTMLKRSLNRDATHMTQAMSVSATYRPLGNSGITNAVDTAGSVRSSAPALNNRRPPTPWAGLSSTAPPLTALRSRSSREKCPVDAILAVVCIALAVEDVPDSVTLMDGLDEVSGLEIDSDAGGASW